MFTVQQAAVTISDDGVELIQGRPRADSGYSKIMGDDPFVDSIISSVRGTTTPFLLVVLSSSAALKDTPKVTSNESRAKREFVTKASELAQHSLNDFVKNLGKKPTEKNIGELSADLAMLKAGHQFDDPYDALASTKNLIETTLDQSKSKPRNPMKFIVLFSPNVG